MSRLTIIFLTVFIDLIGFGIVLPLLPFYAQDYGATPALIGLMVAAHPAMQFLFSPIWGRLSDRYGRRPILLIGLVGSGLSYLLFGLATNLVWLFASRLMAGVAGANIPVAQAYIADSTDASNRTRGMGLVGAAFGLGFIAGPAIGGGLSHFGYAVPGLFAAALSFVNAGAAYFYLPESLTPELRARAAEVTAVSPIARLKLAAAFARLPAMTTLMAIYVLATFVFAVFTTVFPLLIEDRLGYGPRHAGYLMAYLGLLMAIVQGRLIGPMAHRFGERKLLVMGTVALVPAYALMPAAWALVPMAAVMVLVALGSGLNWPTLNSLASQYSPPDSQGGVLGVMQSLSALGRTAGAVWAGWVYGTWTPATPFALNSVLMALAAALAIMFMIRAPAPPMTRSEPAAGTLV